MLRLLLLVLLLLLLLQVLLLLLVLLRHLLRLLLMPLLDLLHSWITRLLPLQPLVVLFPASAAVSCDPGAASGTAFSCWLLVLACPGFGLPCLGDEGRW